MWRLSQQGSVGVSYEGMREPRSFQMRSAPEPRPSEKSGKKERLHDFRLVGLLVMFFGVIDRFQRIKRILRSITLRR